MNTSTSSTTLIATTLKALGEALGEFRAYSGQLDIPEIEGTRIVKCLYKGERQNKNSYVRIPCKHLTEELIVGRINELSPYVLTWLQSLEDAAIKELHKNDVLNVYCESLSLDKIIEKLEESELGARLNAAKIESWFAAALEPQLAEAFATRLGLNEDSSEAELQKLENVLAAYKGKFVSLASGKTFIKQEDCNAMIRCIETCGAADSLLGKRFIARLNNMQTKENDLLLAL